MSIESTNMQVEKKIVCKQETWSDILLCKKILSYTKLRNFEQLEVVCFVTKIWKEYSVV